ncbi:MAG: HigA family addiction module antidote protein [Acidobacteria bacterium]|nr:HigA family addiction module antidote protein [Acidobacteriota bacterium]
MTRKRPKLPPIHPGETVREDFLKPLNLSVNRLALELHVPVTRINEIVNGRRSITADTALRLARYFGTTAQFWMNLQANYDLEVAQDATGERIESQVKPRCAA